MADRLARSEPAGYPGDARLRRRQALARTSEEGSRLDPVYRRAADRAGLRRIYSGRDKASPEAQGRAELSGHIYRRPQICAANLRHDAKRDDETPRGAVSVQLRLPGCNGKRLQAGGTIGYVCRHGYRGNFATAVEATERRAAAGIWTARRRSSRRLIPRRLWSCSGSRKTCWRVSRCCSTSVSAI